MDLRRRQEGFADGSRGTLDVLKDCFIRLATAHMAHPEFRLVTALWKSARQAVQALLRLRHAVKRGDGVVVSLPFWYSSMERMFFMRISVIAQH